MRSVLNVGGNDRQIELPPIYRSWRQVWLDIDPAVQPDVLCDARNLVTLPGEQYEAIYCSHNLEHYYQHEVGKVLAGFHHLLKADGFIHIRVPDLEAVMRTMLDHKLDIGDVLYTSPAGPITVRDVIYGYGVEIERSGNDFFAHKTGFTSKSLLACLNAHGFGWVFMGAGQLEIMAYGFKQRPAPYAVDLLGITLPD